MNRFGFRLPVAFQFGDQRSRFAAQEVQNPSIPVGDRRCHLDSSLSQMLHEVQIKREFFCSQLFKESKYILTFIGPDKKITVFNT